MQATSCRSTASIAGGNPCRPNRVDLPGKSCRRRQMANRRPRIGPEQRQAAAARARFLVWYACRGDYTWRGIARKLIVIRQAEKSNQQADMSDVTEAGVPDNGALT